MTLADTNFWLALSLSRHLFHPAAQAWFKRQSAPGSVLFCRATQQSLLRLLTTDSVLRPYGIPPLTNAAAWSVHDQLLADRRIEWAGEPDPAALTSRWKALGATAAASPKLWMDAYLAAFAIESGQQLVTTDTGFRQFKGLHAIVLEPTRAGS